MKRHKLFLVKICDIENVTVKELITLTGKSQSVVYSWLNLSKPDFPTIESLEKIIFRLGISLDDFINCRHPVYDNGEAARIYNQYVYGFGDQSYIGKEILDLPNAEEIIRTYLYDRMHLNNMIQADLNGLEIDKDRFDFLCKALMPVLVSDIITDAEQSIYDLNSDTLNSYKLGMQTMKEMEEDRCDNPDFDMPEHYICFPDAHEVILLAADTTPSLINEYLGIINEREKAFLLDRYMRICEDNPNYDKKKKIIKRLIESDIRFFDEKSRSAKEKYCELTKRILGIL